jgi:pimeloyl-ACP methyl ester carboxylesterase
MTRLKITLGKANADAHALASLTSDEQVTVLPGRDIAFIPRRDASGIGVILYPGGRCDSRAYAPIMKPLAAAGHHVFVACMPLRMAVLDSNRAEKIIAANPQINTWILGGHSMGGAMAAAYVYKHPGALAGLFFIAAYAASMHAMPDSPLPMAMLYGTRDNITRQSEFAASHERLPHHTAYKAIEGGDHYQFGSFGNVAVTATISRDEQQRQTIAALLAFLQDNQWAS